MNLYSRRTFPARFALLLACILIFTSAFGQRRKPHKLRATALLELTTERSGTVTARLTPITILDQGSFQDASIYKSRPRPMALDDGVVYEAQKSGVPVGYVTIGNASKGAGIWTALGKWQPVATVARKAEQPVAPSSPEDDRPHLHRGDSSPGPGPESTSPPPSPVAQTAPAPTPEPEPEPDDSDRPVLRRRSPGASHAEAEATPTPRVITAPPQGSVPAAAPPAPSPGTQTYVAVSDSQPIDTRSFEFKWKPGEEEKMDARMRRLALAQLPPENSRLGDNALTNVVIRSFDLDLSNDAVMVLTAEVPGSYMTPNRKSAPGKFVSRYITLIARVDFEGVPHRLAVSVTDSSRLDIAPRLELIDAVDVDGDGLAELLFREYNFDEKGFIVYGIGRGAVTKVFEGATEPLR